MNDKHRQIELIKSFSSYINTIIDKGIMNDTYTLDRLEQFIRNYNIIIPQYNYNGDDEDPQYNGDEEDDPDFIQSSEESSSDDEEPETINKLYKEKIDRFLNKSNDISSIHLYNKSSHYIDDMNKFIDNIKY